MPPDKGVHRAQEEKTHAQEVVKLSFLVHLPLLDSVNVHPIDYVMNFLAFATQRNHIYLVATGGQRPGILQDTSIRLVKRVGKHADSHRRFTLWISVSSPGAGPRYASVPAAKRRTRSLTASAKAFSRLWRKLYPIVDGRRGRQVQKAI